MIFQNISAQYNANFPDERSPLRGDGSQKQKQSFRTRELEGVDTIEDGIARQLEIQVSTSVHEARGRGFLCTCNMYSSLEVLSDFDIP